MIGKARKNVNRNCNGVDLLNLEFLSQAPILSSKRKSTEISRYKAEHHGTPTQSYRELNRTDDSTPVQSHLRPPEDS